MLCLRRCQACCVWCTVWVCVGCQVSGFRCQGSGLRARGSGLGARGSGLGARGSGGAAFVSIPAAAGARERRPSSPLRAPLLSEHRSTPSTAGAGQPLGRWAARLGGDRMRPAERRRIRPNPLLYLHGRMGRTPPSRKPQAPFRKYVTPCPHNPSRSVCRKCWSRVGAAPWLAASHRAESAPARPTAALPTAHPLGRPP